MRSKVSVLVVLVLAAIVSVSYAGITEDVAAAEALLAAKNYTGAKAAYEKIIADYPAGDIDVLANIQMAIGNLLNRSHRYVEAQAAYAKVKTEYPTADEDILAESRYRRASTIQKQGDYSAAQAAYAEVKTDYPTADEGVLVKSLWHVGFCLDKQGLYPAAQVAYETLVTDHPSGLVGYIADAQFQIGMMLYNQDMQVEADAAWLKIAYYGDTDVLRRSVDDLRLVMTPANYRDYLVRVLQVVRAIEENVPFITEVENKVNGLNRVLQ